MTRYYEYLKAHLGESSLGDWTGYRFYATPIDFIEKIYLYMFTSIFVELEKDYALEREKWQNDLERYIENGRCIVDEQSAISALIVLGIGDEKTLGAQLVENIEKADRHLKTGMFGAQFLYKTLEKIGRTDLAYCVITNPSEPSFRVWIEQGATTLWESFDTDARTLSKIITCSLTFCISSWKVYAEQSVCQKIAITYACNSYLSCRLLSVVELVVTVHFRLNGKEKTVW